MTKLILYYSYDLQSNAGIEGEILFYVPDFGEMLRERLLSMDADNVVLLMGRKTWELLNPAHAKRLSKFRQVAIASRQPNYRPAGVEVWEDLEYGVRRTLRSGKSVVAIGGCEVLNQLVASADEVCVNVILDVYRPKPNATTALIKLLSPDPRSFQLTTNRTAIVPTPAGTLRYLRQTWKIKPKSPDFALAA